MELGRYMPQSELDEVDHYERMRLADSIAYTSRDMTTEARNAGFLPLAMLAQSVKGGYPEVQKQIYGLLCESDTLQKCVDEWTAFNAALDAGQDLLRFRFYRPKEILERLRDLQREPLHFTVADGFTPDRQFFISADEIDEVLREGSGNTDYRLGVYAFYATHKDKAEREKYLKDYHGEYSGHCGGNDNITRIRGKGIEFSHGSITAPYAKVTLKWPEAAKRIGELISQNKFLSDADRAAMPKYEREQLARKIVNFFMDTPEDVIDLSTLYMRIYFLGMPFFMLYNYGAAILRAVGDTKRPLVFLIISGCANALLNLFFVIICHLSVAGVGIGTVISQLISCILVLRCLYQTEGSYQLRFSKLSIKGEYLKQIFQVGLPAGIQSTVINFSNVLLQSSVNSFGSIAMAGYTAANNIFGFLYVTVNAVTQACMSFTSQNYGVGKWKRMDRVLIDCLILSFVAMMILGNSAYFFGPKLLTIYTSNSKVIQCGMEILLYTTVTYFLCGFMDLFPGALRGMGRSGVPMILSIIGTVGTRIVWIFWIFPNHRSLDILFISYPASWIITIVLQVICYYFVRKQLYAKMRAEA